MAADGAIDEARAGGRFALWQRFDAGEISAAEVEARLQLLDRAADDQSVAAATTGRLPLRARLPRRGLLLGLVAV
ncbi:MAG: hypothetical protein H0W25_18660, partial [Acidimicrobiia bacterium]|nr:hypothetical protein [Acidimicrobiia bacterium]